MASENNAEFRKSARRRALEVLAYFAIAVVGVTALLVAVVWYIDKYPDAPPPDGAAFTLISTPILFGWLVKWRRQWVRFLRFWVLFLLLLSAHSITYWRFVVPLRPFPMPLLLLLWVVEGAFLGTLTDWVMRRIQQN